jgi:hypothetical protein
MAESTPGEYLGVGLDRKDVLSGIWHHGELLRWDPGALDQFIPGEPRHRYDPIRPPAQRRDHEAVPGPECWAIGIRNCEHRGVVDGNTLTLRGDRGGIG